MKRLGLLWCAICVGCGGLPGPAEPLAGDAVLLESLAEPPFFLQLADPQMGFAASPLALQFVGLSWDDDPTATEIALFERAIAHANRLRPAFVVICGDLLNVPGHPSQRAAFERVAGQLDAGIPLRLVAGNHDVGAVPTAASLAAYRADFGPDWYVFDDANVRGIVLNSALLGWPGGAPDEARAQWTWLEAELAAPVPPGRHRIVFLHHPLFLERPDEDDGYFNLPAGPRARLLALLQAGGVGHVFAGHYHRNALAQAGELEMVTTGPVGKPLGDAVSGLRVVHTGGGAVRHGFFGISEAGSAPH